MRKGEKLLEYLAKQENTYLRGEYPPYGPKYNKQRLEFFHRILENISDEEFNRIIFDAPSGDYIDGYKIGSGT